MIIQYIIAGIAIGLTAGILFGRWSYAKGIVAEKRSRYARKKERQKKILGRFRVEIKNDTIRLKKELKRLKLSKQLATFDVTYKNYNKRIYKVADKELMQVLREYYEELHMVETANETHLKFIEKNIQPHEKLEDEITALFYNSMAAGIIGIIEKIVEKGPVIIGILEEKIEAI